MNFDNGSDAARMFDLRDEVRIEAPSESGGDLFTFDRTDRRENLDVQVRLAPKGLWHKKAIGGFHTACGIAIGDYHTRGESYVGPLCPTCFTPFEHTSGAAVKVEYPTEPDAPRGPREPKK
jgi:hypothetical protein